MLELNPQIVCIIINKAHEFQAKQEVDIPEPPESVSDDWAMQVLASHQGDLTFQQVDTAIKDLEPDQQVQLVALMWLGRGDFDVEEWTAALDAAGDAWNERAAEYLIATPLLADYLSEGLDLLGYSCEE